MLLRIRSKTGMWRLEDLTLNTTITTVSEWITSHHGIPIDAQLLTLSPKSSTVLVPTSTLAQNHLSHGSIIFLDYEGDDYVTSSNQQQKKINSDGSVTSATFVEAHGNTGFRPGLKSLRDMKLQWTLAEFMLMDASFEFKLQAQKAASVTSVALDGASCDSFQQYCRTFAFQQARCGWLYGTINEEKEITVEFIYEPPQRGDPYGFEVLDDPSGATMDQLASYLGYTKVGWVFSHPPRVEASFIFSSREILLAAQLQLDAGGAGGTFLTVKVTVAEDSSASFEAFQVSDQCLDMFSAGALVEDPSMPTVTCINPTFTALVEAKAATTVDNAFFLTVVPVKPHTSFLSNYCPKATRMDTTAATQCQALGQALSNGTSMLQAISNVDVLLLLSTFMDLSDLATICASVASPEELPLDEGFQMIINSIAGR